MKFRGFYGEKMEVKVTKDVTMEHDHLNVFLDGKLIWYAHLLADCVVIFPEVGEDTSSRTVSIG